MCSSDLFEMASAVAMAKAKLMSFVFIAIVLFVLHVAAFLEAGCPEEAFHVLDQLRKNSIIEHRFTDTAYYHWIVSTQYLELAGVE